ncbi:MAG: hypothetical protein ACRDKB_10040 [Actinomycetota bacterium]
MAIPERVYEYTDKPMTWTRALVLGSLIFAFAIVFLGQLPSWIIYEADNEVEALIDLSKKLPVVSEEGLNPAQIQIVRDLVANGVQITILIGMLVFAYFWQEKKRKRTGAKGVQDTVKGYLSGK